MGRGCTGDAPFAGKVRAPGPRSPSPVSDQPQAFSASRVWQAPAHPRQQSPGIPALRKSCVYSQTTSPALVLPSRRNRLRAYLFSFPSNSFVITSSELGSCLFSCGVHWYMSSLGGGLVVLVVAHLAHPHHPSCLLEEPFKRFAYGIDSNCYISVGNAQASCACQTPELLYL